MQLTSDVTRVQLRGNVLVGVEGQPHLGLHPQAFKPTTAGHILFLLPVS
jgi:hypothetical protein